MRYSKLDSTAKIGDGSYCVRAEIGRYSYIGEKCVVVNAKIGSFCSIASYCCIGGGSHPTNFISTSPVFYKSRNAFGVHFSDLDFKEDKPVQIGNDVWIGEKVFIKDGITIGHGAIIGAKSVVTHNVPPYAIVGGVPARIIRFRFDDESIKTLLKIEWWNLTNDKLKAFAKNIEGADIVSSNIIEIFNSL